ncbi:MAG: hypothetical protein ABSF17_08390 [Terracidiphilus sp.]|jgi:hypothetical protein
MSETPNPYDLVIADLENKRDQINAAIEMLRALSSTGAIALPLPASPSKALNSEADIPRDAFFGMTIPEAAKKYLSIAKVTKSNADLCAALLRGGFKTQAVNFSEVVRSTLQRHQDFVKVSGEWGLAEWYGNRGGGRKRKANGNAQEASDGAEKEEPSEASPDGSSTI